MIKNAKHTNSSGLPGLVYRRPRPSSNQETHWTNYQGVAPHPLKLTLLLAKHSNIHRRCSISRDDWHQKRDPWRESRWNRDQNSQGKEGNDFDRPFISKNKMKIYEEVILFCFLFNKMEVKILIIFSKYKGLRVDWEVGAQLSQQNFMLM